jgi:hypothetical protein
MRPDKEDLPQWLFRETGHEWVAVPLALVFLMLTVYGVSLIAVAVRERKPGLRWWLDCYDLWLGAFFLGDAFFYGILTLAITEDSSVDAWVAALFILIAFPAMMAFRLWLIGRKT